MNKKVNQPKDSGWKWTDLYQDIEIMNKGHVMPEAIAKRFAHDLVAWAKADNNAIRIQQFLADRDVSLSAYNNWKMNYPVIKNADAQARMIISNRRELNAITRNWSETASFKMMHRYDPEWQEELDLKKAHELAMKTPPAPEVDKDRYEYYAYKDADGKVQLVGTHETETKHVDD